MNIAMGSRDFQTLHAFPGDEEEAYHVNLVPFIDSINHGYDLAQENGESCLSCDMKFPYYDSSPPHWSCTTYCDIPKGTPLMFPYAMHGHHPCAHEGVRNYGFYDPENWLPCDSGEADEVDHEAVRPAASEDFEARHLRKDSYDIDESVVARWFNRELGVFAEDGKFFEGRVAGDNGDGTYAIAFSDGDYAERVELEDIRVVVIPSPTSESE